MNKYQEALDKIDKTSIISEYYQDEVKLIQELVDKATPKKPIFDYLMNECKCSNCNHIFGYAEEEESNIEKINYCYNCGQAIDWSTDE